MPAKNFSNKMYRNVCTLISLIYEPKIPIFSHCVQHSLHYTARYSVGNLFCLAMSIRLSRHKPTHTHARSPLFFRYKIEYITLLICPLISSFHFKIIVHILCIVFSVRQSFGVRIASVGATVFSCLCVWGLCHDKYRFVLNKWMQYND